MIVFCICENKYSMECTINIEFSLHAIAILNFAENIYNLRFIIFNFEIL